METTDVVPVFQGRACSCVPTGTGYTLQTPTGRCIGTLACTAQGQTWVFRAMPNTVWTSGTLADIGVWLRRLQRQRPQQHMRSRAAKAGQGKTWYDGAGLG